MSIPVGHQAQLHLHLSRELFKVRWEICGEKDLSSSFVACQQFTQRDDDLLEFWSATRLYHRGESECWAAGQTEHPALLSKQICRYRKVLQFGLQVYLAFSRDCREAEQSFRTDQSLLSPSGSEGIPHLKSQQALAENYSSPQAGIKLMVDGEILSYSYHTSETITMAPGRICA